MKRGIYIFIAFLFSNVFLLKSQDTIRSRCINFGVQLAVIGNNSLSNVYGSEYEYTSPFINVKSVRTSNNPISFGFLSGFELIIGKSKKIKQLVGLDYSLANSNFQYKYDATANVGAWKTDYYYESINKKRSVQLVGFNYGVKFQYKTLSLGVVAVYNYFLNRTEFQNGYIIKSNGTIMPDTTYINNKKIKSSSSDTNFVSLKLRAGFDLKMRSHTVTIFLMRNFNILNMFLPEHAYLAPWWYFGIQIRPSLKRK